MKLRRGKSKKVRYNGLLGGPYAGATALLPEETMVFCCNGFTGRYVEGKWENVR